MLAPITPFSYIQKKAESDRPLSSPKPSFKAHPDFAALKKNYDITASSYFRRGPMYGSPSEQFKEVIEALKVLFQKKTKKDALIIGVAESQEPFSMLAVVKDLFKQKPLEEVINLNCVDMQSKIPTKKLFTQSFLDSPFEPRFVPDSFVYDNNACGKWDVLRYRVKDEIFEFLSKTYKNKEKTKWNSRVQDVIKDYPNESFDLISMNNTIAYIKDKQQRIDVLENIKRTLKPEGIVITDPYADYSCAESLTVFADLQKLFDGIYRKPKV